MYHETSSNDPNRARYCVNIGNSISHTGRYKECAQWYDRALRLYVMNGFEDHPSIGTLHLNRGSLFADMNKFRQALGSYNMALAIFLRHFGENHPRTASCYNVMGQLFEKRRQISRAIEYYKKSLHIFQTVLPSAHPRMIDSHLSLAEAFLYPRHQDLEQALQMTEISSLHRSTSLDIHLTIHEILKRMGNRVEIIACQKNIQDFVISRNGQETGFVCRRCYRSVWIYRCFEWMKDTRFNCLVFHDFFTNIYLRIRNSPFR